VTCPYCREEIHYIKTNKMRIIQFYDLPPEEKDEN
jgi:hypothetical protein